MNVCEFSNVTKRYGDRVILDRVNRSICQGRNGCTDWENRQWKIYIA